MIEFQQTPEATSAKDLMTLIESKNRSIRAQAELRQRIIALEKTPANNYKVIGQAAFLVLLTIGFGTLSICGPIEGFAAALTFVSMAGAIVTGGVTAPFVMSTLKARAKIARELNALKQELATFETSKDD